MRNIGLCVLRMIAGCVVLAAQGSQIPGKWIGTWQMNFLKSQFPPGAKPPEKAILTIEAIPGGVKFTSNLMIDAGTSRQLQFAGLYGGSGISVVGNAAQPGQTASVKLIDESTSEVVWTIPGLGMGFNRFVVSGDGKTLTNTSRQVYPGNVEVKSISTYDRVP